MQQFRVDYPVTTGSAYGSRVSGIHARRSPSLELYLQSQGPSKHYRKRSLGGTFAIGIFVLAMLLVFIAFCTPYWLESDQRIVGAKFDKLGLWVHCFRSLQDQSVQFLDRYYTGCRWVFDPFTTGYADMRWFLVPPFFVAVQFFFTMCFILLLFACVLVPAYLMCFGPEHPYYVLLIRVIGITLLISAVLGSIAVIVFGAMGDSRVWMPDWQNNYLSWSFAFGVVGVFCEYVSGILFLVESKIQNRKKMVRESQSAYTMESKA